MPRYRSAVCLNCGREIHESAFSGRAGNFRRHVEACEAASVPEMRRCRTCETWFVWDPSTLPYCAACVDAGLERESES